LLFVGSAFQVALAAFAGLGVSPHKRRIARQNAVEGSGVKNNLFMEWSGLVCSNWPGLHAACGRRRTSSF